MNENLENSLFLSKKLDIISLIFFLIFLMVIYLLAFYPFGTNQKGEFGFGEFSEENSAFPGSIVIQGNSLLAAPNPLLAEEELQVVRKIKVIVTAYSSSPWETDDTPYLTAAGTMVRDGIVATNILPFGTKIKLSSIYGDKIFVVEDRMNSRKGYHVDVWHPSYLEAKQFGVKLTEMEVIEEG